MTMRSYCDGVVLTQPLQVCLLREKAHQKKNFTPEGSIDTLTSGTYYLTEVDDMFRRKYEIKA